VVSLSDPDARPIRKGKLGKPNEFGYVVQIAEVTANTRRGARGGFVPGPTEQTLTRLAPARTFISGRVEPGSRRTRKRLARYRTGCEGRISHLTS
jgi:hypothetical protein